MNIAPILCICLFMITPNRLDLGVRLGKGMMPKTPKQCAATPSQTYPCVELAVEGVEFTVGYDAKSSRIHYLSTQDQRFQTKEGVQVGSWIRVHEDELLAIKGWKIFGPRTKSGWRIVVGYLGEEVRFADGTVIDLSLPKHTPPRTGKVQILELEKGGI